MSKRAESGFRTAALLLTFAVLCVPLAAQSISGTILGTFYDASGAVVTGANVVAKNTGQGWTRALPSWA